MNSGETKTEEIKIRLDPLTKLALTQMARQQELSLSGFIRREMKRALGARTTQTAERRGSG